MWVEEGVWHDVRQLERAAELFEADIYPTVHAAFGSEWSPGIDGDIRISILHASKLGENVLGYASSLDEYPCDVYPRSNEAEMITINIERVDVGSLSYQTLVAREFVRLVQWYQDRNEERWVREGLSELAATMVGSDAAALHQAYLEETDTPLIGWTATDSHRGAAHLFMTYFHQRFGDEGTLALTAEAANGIKGFDAALEKMGAGLTFDDLFADWLAANVIDNVLEADDARYAYPDLQLARPTVTSHDSYPVEIEGAVHQYGADYIVLEGENDLHIQFTGETQTRLFEKLSHTGSRVWWSNRADESLTSLSGRFDLREIDEATLSYRVRYDIEPHYDYATVEISIDDGQQWHILRAPSGTGQDPHGNNPGWGYTGTSDGWIRETIDISDYAGDEALVRFSYLTDGAITGESLLLDGISVPEMHEEGDERRRWTAHGFVLTDGWMQQDYLALLIRPGKKVTVERLALEDDQSGDWVIPLGSKDLQDVVLVLSAMTPRPAPPAPYQLTIHQ